MALTPGAGAATGPMDPPVFVLIADNELMAVGSVRNIRAEHSGYDDQPVRLTFVHWDGGTSEMLTTPNEAHTFLKTNFDASYARDAELGTSNATPFNPLPPGGGIQKP